MEYEIASSSASSSRLATAAWYINNYLQEHSAIAPGMGYATARTTMEASALNRRERCMFEVKMSEA